MSETQSRNELHQRWSENYQYIWRGVRADDGRFMEHRESHYQGRIYDQYEFTMAVENAKRLKEELDP